MLHSRKVVCFYKTVVHLFVIAFLTIVSALPTETFAAEYSIYGPRIFFRGLAESGNQIDTIVAPVPGNYLLKIYNGGLRFNDYAHITSSVITVNGVEILALNELTQETDYIEKTVALQQTNELIVEINGSPRSAFIIGIDGTDNVPPIITSIVTPQANENGWHNSNVSITFECTDDASGVANCPEQALVNTEGEQWVSEIAVDNAGNEAIIRVLIPLDKTPPVVNIASPADGALVSQAEITVIGQAYDTASSVTLTINGNAVTLQTDGNFSQPVTLLVGSNILTVLATDSAGNVTESYLSVTLESNQPPVAVSLALAFQEDTSSNFALSANDPDGDVLSYQILTQPLHGVLSGIVPNLVYTPNTDFRGTDSFTYLVNDGTVDSNIATVTFDIQSVNDAPVANNIDVNTVFNTEASIVLTGVDLELDPLTYHIVSQPANGVLTGAGSNYSYTPAIGYSGVDSFQYVVNDGELDSVASTVTITVESSIAPVITSEPVVIGFVDQVYFYSVEASDPNELALQYTLLNSPDGMSIDSSGLISWSPVIEAEYSVTVVVTNAAGDITEQSYQIIVVNPEPSNEGDDFWVAFNFNIISNPGGAYIYISSNTETTGLVESSGLNISIPFTVIPNETTVVELDLSVMAGSAVENKGIHITSENNITVYGLNQRRHSTDGYLALPTRTLGTDYLLADYPDKSQAVFVATEDDTVVNLVSPRDLVFVPNVEVAAGDTHSVTLQKGQTYHLLEYTAALSGVSVTSNKPIAIFSGGTCSNVPTNFGFCDHLVEQLSPVKYWGTEFMSLPLATRFKGDTFVVVASVDNTQIKINGDILTEINRGEWIEKIIDEPGVISANHPIMVNQFSNGSSYDLELTGNATKDPFMMLLPAKEHFLKRYTFATPNVYIIDNFVNVILPVEGLATLVLDGVEVDTSQFVQIGNSNWWGMQLPVSVGSHTLSAGVPFGAAIYGFGDFESYGYAGGMLLPDFSENTTIAIEPYEADKLVGDNHCIDVNVTNDGLPVISARVRFDINGVHDYTAYQLTDLKGFASYCYIGSFEGFDDLTVTSGSVEQQGSLVWANVFSGDGQQKPVFTSSPILDASVGFEYRYTVNAFDADEFTILNHQLLVAPQGMSLGASNEITWIPLAIQTGDHAVIIEVADNEGNIALQEFTVHVSQRNRAPEIISSPASISAYIGHTYTSTELLAVDPDGDAVRYELISGPTNFSVNTFYGEVTYTPNESAIGEFSITLRVSDGLGAYTDITIPVTVIVNKIPALASNPLAQAKVGFDYIAQLDFVDEDNTNGQLIFTKLNVPAGFTIDSNGVMRWQPTEADIGENQIVIKISDTVDTVYHTFLLTVYNETEPFDIFVNATPRRVSLGDSTAIQLGSAGATNTVAYTLTVDGIDVPVDENGQAVYSNTDHYGIYEMVIVGNDGHFLVTVTDYFSVINPNDVVAPTAIIEAPTNLDKVTGLTSIIASISDANLVEYQLYLSPASNYADRTLIAEGLSQKATEEIATLDPSMMVNGLYHLTLIATDTGGLTGSAQIAIRIDGDLKVGNFSFTVEDMNIPMSGLPIRVTRTYDSRRKAEDLDFGYGWSLSYQDAKVDESRTLGNYWQLSEYSSGSFGEVVEYCVESQGAPLVVITLPNGETHTFEVSVTPPCNLYVPITDVKLVFTPVDNTQSTLELQESQLIRLVGNRLEILGSNEAYDPEKYILTTRQGFKYYLNQSVGIEKLVEPNGNTLTYTANGIDHSDGRSITITRDAKGHVTSIRDFVGNLTSYHYNLASDLTSAINVESGDATYKYNYRHGLIDIQNANGDAIIKNIYNDSGRLVAQENSNGERTEFNHNLVGQESVITNTRGYSTVFNYDEKGNVLSTVDALGNVTQYEYDERGNQLTTTDAEGDVITATYNENNDQLTQTDALGNTINFSYNQRGQEIDITDAKGNVFSNTYDSVGNLLTVTDPDGNLAGNNINAKGLVESTQDALGNITLYSYDEVGNKQSETNALGYATTYTHDTNGNILTESRQRTVAGVAETNTTVYRYGFNQVITITNALGDRQNNSYNALRQQSSSTGASIADVSYVYDAYNRLVETKYIDNSVATKTYDGEGNLLSETDRNGHITTYIYDALNRLIQTNNADASSTQTEYDTVGRVTAEIDENNNRTEHEYDAAGRRVLTRNALGFITEFSYDVNSNLIAQTDANGHITQHQYDSLDNRIKTTFADNSETSQTYDALGRVIEKTDQNGFTTQYQYNAIGQLEQVIDTNGNITAYSYDEAGNKLTQTDALGRVTSWTYDALNREQSRTLPLQQKDLKVYDSEGKVTQTEDFNGQRVYYTDFANSNLKRVLYATGGNEEYLKDSEGNRISAKDLHNQHETWTYDNRNRVTNNTKTTGDQLDYSYDSVGNRTQLTITPSGGTEKVINYSFDALNRLKTVSDAQNQVTTYSYDNVGNRESISYTNGNVTNYTYDNLNRLIQQNTLDNLSNVLVDYQYILDAAGHRTQITEANGRTTNYTYDNLYRLTTENITDALNSNYNASYQYDTVGNRTQSTINGVQTLYTVDNNDRLTQQGGETYTYDDNGNTLTKAIDADISIYNYTPKNELEQADITVAGTNTLTSYQYDIDGIRSRKVVGGEAIDYLTDANRAYAQVLKETNTTTGDITDYLYGDDLIKQTKAANDSYYLYDGLGSTRALTNSTGVITDTYNYESFGEVLNQTGATPNDYLFTGEQFDSDLDNYYLRARYYDQNIGRFTQQDTWMGLDKEPITLNKYIYGEADSVNNIDPSGNFSLSGLSAAINIQRVLATASSPAVRVGFSFLQNTAGNIVGIATTTCAASIAATRFGIVEPIAQFSKKCDGSVHRGRWQAQGGGLEKSVPWNQSTPPTLAQGLQMLNDLKLMLKPKEQRARAAGFVAAEIFARRTAFAGGLTASPANRSRSFPRGTTIRVDFELITGRAFVPD